MRHIVGIVSLLYLTLNVLTLIFTIMSSSKIWNFFTRNESNKTAICSTYYGFLKSMVSISLLWTHRIGGISSQMKLMKNITLKNMQVKHIINTTVFMF